MNKRKILNIINKQRILIAIVLVAILLSFGSDVFLSFENIKNIFMQISILGIVAIGMTLLMLQGEIDLSVSYNISLVGTVIILLQKYNLVLAVVCGVIVGTLIGFINGLLVTRFKVSSIPITLGMMIALRGAVLWLTNSQTLKGVTDSFLFLGNSSFYSIPYPVIIFIIIFFIFLLIVGRTVYGRNLYAIGGNPIASEFFGINIIKTKIASFVICGFLTSIAGVIITSRLNTASSQIGRDVSLFVITAVLLGGTSIWGGEGGIFNTFKGILLLGIIANGLRMVQVPVEWHNVIKGMLLIIIVSIDSYNIKRSKFR